MCIAHMLSVWDPLIRFLHRGTDLLPVLMAVVVVLVGGLLLAWMLETLTRALLKAIAFDSIARRPGVSDSLRRAGLRQLPSELGGRVVRWVAVVLTLLGALSILSAEATDTAITALVNYMPRLATALLLGIAGYAISVFTSRSVLLWAVNSRVQGARWLAGGVRLVIGVFFAALVLENLGFGRDIALVVLAILLGGGVLAAALAFGLAGQDLARQSLERMTREAMEEEQDKLSHL